MNIAHNALKTLLLYIIILTPILKVAVAQNVTSYEAKSAIRCSDSPFQSDVLFVTDPKSTYLLQCITELLPAPPKGYLPAPTSYRWSASSGKIEANQDECRWSQPESGLQEIQVSGIMKYLAPNPTGFFSRKLPDIEVPFRSSLKCLIPLQVDVIKDGKVKGFVVGDYPDPNDWDDLKNASNSAMVKANADIYQPPKLFYCVTTETYNLKIFKEYTLGDFDLDPRFLPLKYPRYVVIHPRILRKLDLLETQVRNAGITLSKFKIFYGYRSPAYNLGSREEDGGITLKSEFSTHMYGLAVDILIDEDDDLVMDDLDGDGRTTEEDAKILLNHVNKLDRLLLQQDSELVGGAGWYPHHDFWERGEYVQSPYVHFDARGYTHGQRLVRWIGKDTIGIRKRSNPYKQNAPIPPWPW